MLTAFKVFLRLLMVPVLYFGSVIAILGTIFKRAQWGLFMMIIMLPQPNLWHKLREYPFGKDYMDFLFVAMLLGIIYQKKGFARTTNGVLILVFIVTSYLAFLNSCFKFSLPIFSPSNAILKDWKNYAEMIFLYFLALNIVKDEDDQKAVVVLIALTVLLIAVRSYRNFTGGEAFRYDKRAGGPFEAEGLGPNHLGAFMADYFAFFVGMALFDVSLRRRLLYSATSLFALHPLFYSYSRGAYLAAMGAGAFLGLVKKRSLLVIIVLILLTWQTILPASVVDRISMTETESGGLEGSAAHRLVLWDQAVELFKQHPIFGIGFGGFQFTVSQGELTDTHSFYMKTLSEQGVIGLAVLAVILFAALASGWRLYRKGQQGFYRGVGFGFMGCVISFIITDAFGDRWSYFPMGGYFWILWGVVDGMILRHKADAPVQVGFKHKALNHS